MNRRSLLKMLGMAVASVPLSGLLPKSKPEVTVTRLKPVGVSIPEIQPGQVWYIHNGLDEALELIPPVHPNCRCAIEPEWFYPYIDAATGEIRGVPEKYMTFFYMTFFDGRIPLEVKDAKA